MSESSFSQKYWKTFEQLSLDIVSEQYEMHSKTKVVATSYIKDGGYDGLIKSALTKNSAVFHHEVLTLMEAKLRSKSVNIHDFAATIIVAFNMAAHMLYIVTNKWFTETTKEQIKQYCAKSNMRIELVSGEVVGNWLDTHGSLAGKYSPEFLEQLRASIDEPIPTVQNVTMTTPGPTQFTWKQSLQTETDISEPERIIGRTLQNTVSGICESVRANRSIYALTGKLGVGKTLALRHVCRRLSKDNYNVSIIDMKEPHMTSIRMVYLEILKALWGIDAFLEFSAQELSEYIEILCSFAGGQPVSKAIRESVKQIFNSGDDFYRRTDLLNNYLVEFLEQLLSPHSSGSKTVIIFTSLNVASFECLEFLIVLIQCLSKHNIGIVLELQNDRTPKIEDENFSWSRYYQHFRRLSEAGGIYELTELSGEEADEFLEFLLPGLSRQNRDLIIRKVGKTQLFLKQTANWLKIKNIVISDENEAYHTVFDFERFFFGITPESCVAIINNTLLHYKELGYSPLNENLLDSLEAAALLNGLLSQQTLLVMFGNKSLAIADRLLSTGLFSYTKGSITVSNELVLECIRANSQPMRRTAAAAFLLEHLVELISDINLRVEKRISLLEITEAWEEMCLSSYRYACDMLTLGDTHKSTKYFKYADNAHSRAENKLGLPPRIDILYHFMLANRGSGTRSRLAEYHTLLNLDTKLRFTEKYYTYTAMSYLAETRLNYKEYGASASFGKANEMLNYLEVNYTSIDNAVRDEIYLAYALVAKNHTGLDDAICLLNEKRGDSTLLNIQYYSHCAAKYLNTDPKAAIPYYEKVLKYAGTDIRYRQNIGHAYVDILTCYFLIEDQKHFESLLHEAFEYVKNNYLTSELGRFYNVRALFEWLENKLDCSESYFRDSEFLLGQSRSATLLSITKVNLIALLAEKNKPVEVGVEGKALTELLLKLELNWYEALNKNKKFKASRRYAKLLSLARSLLCVNDTNQLEILKAIIPVEEFARHVDMLRQGQYPPEVFADTSLMHKGHIMITG